MNLVNPLVIRAGWALAISLVLLSGFAWLQTSIAQTTTPATDEKHHAGLENWEVIKRVLTHPRCLNCHQADQPLQKNGIPHKPEVHRGAATIGDTAMRCTTCHSQHANNPASGVPGAHNWQMAPLSMNWAGLDSKALCEALLDQKKNGGRDPEALVKHMGTDKLVLWGWEPGADREPVSVSQDEFMKNLNAWVAASTPCPEK